MASSIGPRPSYRVTTSRLYCLVITSYSIHYTKLYEKDAPKIFKEDCKIDWNNDAISIRNKIRGLSPYPTAWTEILQNDGNKIGLKLFKVSHCETTNLAEGEFETDGKNYFKVGTARTDLLIDSLQMAGKKRMDVKSFLQGFKAENFTKLC